MTDQELKALPDIKAALDLGFTLPDLKGSPRNVERREGLAVSAAKEKYGPGSPEVQEAIDELNRRSVIYSTARAAYFRTRY